MMTVEQLKQLQPHVDVVIRQLSKELNSTLRGALTSGEVLEESVRVNQYFEVAFKGMAQEMLLGMRESPDVRFAVILANSFLLAAFEVGVQAKELMDLERLGSLNGDADAKKAAS